MKFLLVSFTIILCSCASRTMLITQHADPVGLEQMVRFLADTIGGRSCLQIESLNKTADYIQFKFSEIGLKCSTQSYVVENHEYKNIYCQIDGESKEIFIIGAHYDTFENLPGADDNGSGIAGLIETARIISSVRKPYYTLLFVAFTLEEPPYFRTENMGSYKFAEFIKQSKQKVKGMACLEMIGYFTDQKNQDYPSVIFKLFYPARGNFIATVSNFGSSVLADEYQNHAEALNEIRCAQLTVPSFVTGVDYSDHLNFWHFGFDAFMITNTAFYRNKNYHTIEDKPGFLDYKRMGFVVNTLANMLLGKF